jgi:hypothetical protein
MNSAGSNLYHCCTTIFIIAVIDERTLFLEDPEANKYHLVAILVTAQATLH